MTTETGPAGEGVGVTYLAWSASEPDGDLGEGPWSRLLEIAPGLWLIDSPAGRSRVYHDLKAALPPGAALLVTALPEIPKFKGLPAGTLAWLRARS